MIIFDLDGTLADCEHRRHFVERDHPINEKRRLSEISLENTEHPESDPYIWKPDWRSFYESCAEDTVIEPIATILRQFIFHRNPVEIWSGRCESVRTRTENWLAEKVFWGNDLVVPKVKMRPVGDSTPDHLLKESWLNERCSDLIEAQIKGITPVKHNIQCVFDDRPKMVRMWKRRGIFVFDVNQRGEEF